MAFAGLPVSGTEDVVDLNFFKTYTLPLIKLAIQEFLKVDTIEVTLPLNIIGSTITSNIKVFKLFNFKTFLRKHKLNIQKYGYVDYCDICWIDRN